MSGIRSIHPSFPLRLQHLGVHAQNLALLLPLVCDDAGRVRLEHRKICDVLYPGPAQCDMAVQLDGLIGELAEDGWVERYTVDGADYLRLIEWDKDQKVLHPTESRLPPSPREPLKNTRILEAAKNLTGRDRKREQNRALADDAPEAAPESVEKKFFPGDAPIVVTPQSVVRELQQIGDDARQDGQHGAAIRAVLEKARFAGVAVQAGGRPDPVAALEAAGDGDAAEGLPAGAEPALVADERTPSPAAAHGLPRSVGRA